jgi:phage gp36-like protein
MGYAVQADIEQRYGENFLWTVADRDGDGVLDSDAISRALEDGAAEIDVYLNGRYSLPLATVPRTLVLCCVDITAYNLATGTALSDEIKERYNRAIGLLKRISDGKADLGLPEPQKPAPAGGGGSVQTGRNDFGAWRP